jgi:hypothetical protein
MLIYNPLSVLYTITFLPQTYLALLDKTQTKQYTGYAVWKELWFHYWHFSLLQRPDQLWGPLTQDTGWYSFGVKQLGHEADQSTHSSAEFINEWSRTSNPSYAFMVCRGNTLFLVVKIIRAKGFQDHPQIFSHPSSVFTGRVPDIHTCLVFLHIFLSTNSE